MEEEDNNDLNENIKITLLGNSGVGKTCIIKRFAEDSYNENIKTTDYANYSQKEIKINDISIKLDLWDTAGQEKYRSLGKHFYRDSYIVCLVYDITNLDSFNDLKNNWYNDLKEYGEKYTVIGVLGNKSDCYENEQVKEDIAREYAKSINAIFMLVSAKTGDNINILFETLVREYLGPEFIKKVEEMKKDKGEVEKVTKKSHKKKKRHFC